MATYLRAEVRTCKHIRSPITNGFCLGISPFISLSANFYKMSIEVLVAVAGLAIMAFDIGSLLAGKEPPKDPFAQTTVTIITGLAQHAAGDTPLVHVKSHYGDHLCAMNDYKADIGSSQARTYYMENEYGKMDQPAYVLLKMRAEQNNDICLSGLMLSGNGATYAWTGDLGWKCGANGTRAISLSVDRTMRLNVYGPMLTTLVVL